MRRSCFPGHPRRTPGGLFTPGTVSGAPRTLPTEVLSERVQALTYYFSLPLRAHTPFVAGPNVIGPTTQWSGPVTTASCFLGSCNYLLVSTNLFNYASVSQMELFYLQEREGKSGKSATVKQGKSGGKSGKSAKVKQGKSGGKSGKSAKMKQGQVSGEIWEICASVREIWEI